MPLRRRVGKTRCATVTYAVQTCCPYFVAGLIVDLLLCPFLTGDKCFGKLVGTAASIEEDPIPDSRADVPLPLGPGCTLLETDPASFRAKCGSHLPGPGTEALGKRPNELARISSAKAASRSAVCSPIWGRSDRLRLVASCTSVSK